MGLGGGGGGSRTRGAGRAQRLRLDAAGADRGTDLRVPSGRLPVAAGSESNGFEKGLLSRDASEEQAAAAPPMMPMSVTRDSVRNI